MKVLHVISDLNIGGAGVLLYNLLSALPKGEVESYVALPGQSTLCTRLGELDVPLLPLDHPCDRFSVGSICEIARYIKDKKIDIVHANAALCARIAGRVCGVCVIHTRHCCFPPTKIQKWAVTRRCHGLIQGILSDRIIATAFAARENLLELGTPKNKIVVVINGTNGVRQATKEELEDLREGYSLKETDFTVGICARLEPCKGHRVFLDAARIVLERTKGRTVRFLIVGDGSERTALQAYARSLGISYAVRFTGFVRDAAPYYQLMRINVNVSGGTETSCLALSEGMSASLPMIVSDFGGNRAMVGNSGAGIVIPVNNAVALANGILEILNDPEREATMRAAARKRFESCYTAKRMANEVLRIYREMVEHKKKEGLEIR